MLYNWILDRFCILGLTTSYDKVHHPVLVHHPFGVSPVRGKLDRYLWWSYASTARQRLRSFGRAPASGAGARDATEVVMACAKAEMRWTPGKSMGETSEKWNSRTSWWILVAHFSVSLLKVATMGFLRFEWIWELFIYLIHVHLTYCMEYMASFMGSGWTFNGMNDYERVRGIILKYPQFPVYYFHFKNYDEW